MKVPFLAATLAFSAALSSCSLLYYGATTYGEVQPQGTVVDCGSFTFRTFEDNLRVAPSQLGSNSLVAYKDLGPGWSRDAVFFITTTDGFQSADLGSELFRMDPKHPEMWKEAIHVGGDFRSGGVFWGYIPEKSRTIGNGKIVDRQEMRFVGRVERRGPHKFLLLHLDGDFATPKRPGVFVGMKQRFEKFSTAIKSK